MVYAAAAESVLTFFPLFGMSLGLSENFTLYLLTIVGLGTMILVMPISWLADRVDRMGLLLACVLLDLVPAADSFTGFGHPAVITVAAVLVLSRGLLETGAVDSLTRLVLPREAGPLVGMAALTGLGALM